MRNKLKLGLLALALLLPGLARAQWQTATDGAGNYFAPPDAPCIPYHINATTGTREVVMFSTTTTTTLSPVAVNSGNTATKRPGYINWVMLSTGAATIYLEVRDTDRVGAAPGAYNILPPLMFPGESIDTGKHPYYEFRPPLRFTNGVTLELSSAIGQATVCGKVLQGDINKP